MDSDQHLEDQAVILNAVIKGIQASRINFPDAGQGKQNDRIWVGGDDAGLFAHAAIEAINAAGFRIVRKA